MGGLKPEIANEIRLFKPKTLREVISLAGMKDEQINQCKKMSKPLNRPQNFRKKSSSNTSQSSISRGMNFNVEKLLVNVSIARRNFYQVIVVQDESHNCYCWRGTIHWRLRTQTRKWAL